MPLNYAIPILAGGCRGAHRSSEFAHPPAYNRARYNPSLGVITKSPDILGGTPVLRGTRVPTQTLFDYLESGETLEDFLEGFPAVSRESAVSALEAAKHLFLARDSD
ncbi:MAG: DUF433 domain-containing protein [Candidatus Acidiferrales bacterium]